MTKSEAPNLKFIFFIVDWNRSHVIFDVFDEEKVRFHFVTKGRGTASSEVLDILGIGAGEKAVIMCLEQSVLVPVLLKEVRKKLGFHSPGAGIAFTIPLSAINDPVLLVFKQSIHKNQKIAEELDVRSGGEGENMANELTHDLIVSIVNQGYSDELMNTAREAGATGGTVLNARGQAHEGAVKFFGISVQDEKELIIILTSREKKVGIMRALCETHGLNSKAQGIVFSLPVDDVMGLSFE
ncbi:MAG TPA: hypothetical protein DEQ14_07910 [Treponema sp.]|nr:hypothetical protein [Treponema sp.]